MGFLSALIDQLWNEYDIDLSRVYSTGMSNGGYMSYQLACSLSDRIAAIASVTGSMTVITDSDCDPQRAVPVLQFHGTSDIVVNYNGIPGFSLPLEDVIDYWVDQNGCATTPDTTDIPNTDTTDNSTVELFTYGNCADDTAVEFYKITGGGHTWPGAFPFGVSGATNQDIQASPLIWEFFNRFTHPDPRPGSPVVSTGSLSVRTDLTVSPNPTDGPLRIQLPYAAPATLRLTDSYGREVQRITVSGAVHQLALNQLPSGIYWLRLEYAESLYTQRIVRR